MKLRGSGDEGRQRNGAMESIRWYARLNERNVNHKKLRAFKSPTRWCTFALITLHLSFLPRASVDGEGDGANLSEKNELSPSFSFSFLLYHLLPSPPSLSLSRCVVLFPPSVVFSFAFLENGYLLVLFEFPSLFFSLPLFSYAKQQLFHSWKLSAANRSPSGPYALGDN